MYPFKIFAVVPWSVCNTHSFSFKLLTVSLNVFSTLNIFFLNLRHSTSFVQDWPNLVNLKIIIRILTLKNVIQPLEKKKTEAN